MQKTDFDIIRDYKASLDLIEEVYGSRDKATMYNYLDTKFAGELRKMRNIVAGLFAAGIILSPLMIGIPVIFVAIFCYFKLYKKAVKMSDIFREMTAEDPTLA